MLPAPRATGRDEPASPPRAERRAAALGHVAKLTHGTFAVTGRWEGLLVRAGMDRAAFNASLPHYAVGKAFLGHPKSAQRTLHAHYVAPLVALAEELGHDAPFLVWTGDNRRSFDVPTFARSRTIGHPGLSVLLRYRLPRHIPDTRHLTEGDMPFADKEDRLVWRGATTGRFHAVEGTQNYSSRYYVAGLQRRIDDPTIDIGYSNIVQADHMSERTRARAKAAVRPRISLEAMLRARYVLVLEGNDVASSLSWALHSNSCVLMPVPRSESWLSEGRLEPFVHYVPVGPTLANLPRMLAWCRANTEECARIAAAGRAFITPFYDDAAETALHREVAAALFARVRLEPAPGAALPPGLFD